MQESGRRLAARDRASLSCTECRRKKKKCSAGQPCSRCLRTFPPVQCIYAPVSSGVRPQVPKDEGNRNSSSSANHRSSRQHSQDPPFPSKPLLSFPDSSMFQRFQEATVPRGSSTGNNFLPLDDWDPNYVEHSSMGSFSDEGATQESGMMLAPETDPESGLVIESGQSLISSDSDANDDDIEEVVRNWNVSGEITQYRGKKFPSPFPPSLGFSMFDLLRLQSIAPTRENANLLNLYDKQVVPVILTIDGSECGPNHVFTRTWLPVTAQSPILLRTNLHNGILFRMSAFSIMSLISPLSKQEKLAQMQFDLQQLLTIRGEIIALLNKRLKECELPPDDAIAAVFSFIWYDFVPGNWKEVYYHTRGLREMVRLRGGLKTLGAGGILRKMIILQHFHVSIVCEREPYPILLDDYATPSPPLNSPLSSDRLASPLCSNPGTFTASRQIWNLSEESASVLDDMASLSMKIHEYIISNSPNELIDATIIVEASKIQGRIFLARSKDQVPFNTLGFFIGHSFQDRISVAKCSNELDPYYSSILATADLYTSAILSRTRLSRSYTKSTLAALILALEQVSLERWAQIPGVWVWILLTMNTTVRAGLETGWFHLRGSQQSALLEIALEDYHLGVKCLETFLSVQRWLRAGKDPPDGGDDDTEPSESTALEISRATREGTREDACWTTMKQLNNSFAGMCHRLGSNATVEKMDEQYIL